jgi:hypothetical protein
MRHMSGSNIVVVRDLQHRPAAAVLPVRYDENLGRTTSPLIDHKLMFCAVDSPDEAVYVASFINSTPFQELLESYANEIAIAPQTLARLPIPDFDLQKHQPVVNAGRAAIDAVRNHDPVDMAMVDATVLEALGMSEYASVASSEAQARGKTSKARQSALDL